MKKLLICFCIIMLFSILTVHADTGTYYIEKQVTNLTINLDRSVSIDYYMKWKVNGGNIPWVTLGLPNDNYEIESYGANIREAHSQNQGSWSGVYISLDKTYYENEEFEILIKVLQKDFIKKYNGKASIEFTPVWWDNARIGDLIVRIIPPNEIVSLETGSEPSRFEDKGAVWEWTEVSNGERKTVSALMDIAVFPGLNETIDTNVTSTSGSSSWVWVIFLVIIIFVTLLFSTRRGYESPSLHLSSDTPSTRHINMKCPNDDGLLEKVTIKDTTIDFCHYCGGAYFDKGEIESLIKKDVNEKEFNLTNKKTSTEPKSVITKCPRCEGKMSKRERNKDGISAVIFVCEDCEGLWLNKGMYQTIKDKRLEQEDAAKKKKDDEDHYFPMAWWLFYPHIGTTGAASTSTITHFGGGKSGGGGSSGSYVSSCACVSCACVSACACACACAGGGAAGCSPKNKLKQIQLDKLYPKGGLKDEQTKSY